MSTHQAPVTSRIRMPGKHSGWDRSGGGSRAATAVQTASTTSGRNARMMPGTSTVSSIRGQHPASKPDHPADR